MAICLRCRQEITGTIVAAHDEPAPYSGCLCEPCAWGYSLLMSVGTPFDLPRPRAPQDHFALDPVALAHSRQRLYAMIEASRPRKRH